MESIELGDKLVVGVEGKIEKHQGQLNSFMVTPLIKLGRIELEKDLNVGFGIC